MDEITIARREQNKRTPKLGRILPSLQRSAELFTKWFFPENCWLRETVLEVLQSAFWQKAQLLVIRCVEGLLINKIVAQLGGFLQIAEAKCSNHWCEFRERGNKSIRELFRRFRKTRANDRKINRLRQGTSREWISSKPEVFWDTTSVIQRDEHWETINRIFENWNLGQLRDFSGPHWVSVSHFSLRSKKEGSRWSFSQNDSKPKAL